MFCNSNFGGDAICGSGGMAVLGGGGGGGAVGYGMTGCVFGLMICACAAPDTLPTININAAIFKSLLMPFIL